MAFSDSSSDNLKICFNRLKREHEDDDNVSGGRKVVKPKTFVSSSPPTAPKTMNWTKNDEILILEGIVKYEREMELAYSDDWDLFYDFIKVSFEARNSKRSIANFSKIHLQNKVNHMKDRFKNRKGPRDDQVLKLSKIIWADQKLNESDPAEDVPNVETADTEKEKEKKEKGGVDELCDLEKTLEATLLFPSLDGNQERLQLRSLRDVEAEARKELSEEWMVLLVEELQLKIKKQTFSVKLANARVSA